MLDRRMNSQDPTRPFRLMARNNRLTNFRLGQTLRQLAPGEWEAPRSGFFPSLRSTLNHLLTVDLFYVDALEGGTTGFSHRETPEPYPDLDDLIAVQAEVDQRLIDFCEGLAPADLDRVVEVHRPDRVQREPLPELLLHMSHHATHHRGQVHAMLSATSIAPPPQFDEFLTRDATPARRDEMRALGWSEDYLAS